MTDRDPATICAAFRALADRWQLDDRDCATLLGHEGSDTGNLTSDQEQRISYLLGIFAGLHAVLGPELADTWVRRPNSDFDGDTPLDRMLAGGVDDLAYMRAYVDGWAT